MKDGQLEAAYHSEGRFVAANDNYEKWEFNLKDHLGNVRVVFTGTRNNQAVPNHYSIYINQENHYYPFGMPISGPWHNNQQEKNEYLYNGKEYNTDLGLNWSDYGARFYDPQIGRFTTVDPMADLMPSHSTYSYSFNNPINYTDPDGQIPLPAIAIWAGKRAAAGIIADIVVQLAAEWVFNGGSLGDAWNRLDIDGWQALRSGGENIVKGKFTAAALSAAGDMLVYITTTENWTWSGAILAAGEGGISSLLGDQLGKLFLKKLRKVKVEKRLNSAVTAASQKINSIRSSFGISKSRNIGYLEGEIGGKIYSGIGVSGKALRNGTIGNPTKRFFKTKEIGGYDRLFDSEVKLLEDFAQKYHRTPNIRGTIRLVSERPFCESCSGVVQQFQKMFPNIRLEAISGVNPK